MILIPGLESSGAVWHGAVSHYCGRYRMYARTLAGFAGEPPVPGLQLRDVRDGIIRLIRENKLERPVVVGHILGGFLNIRTPLLLVGSGKTPGDRTQQVYQKQLEKARDHRVVLAQQALHFVMFDDPAFLWSAMDSFLAEGGIHAR